MSFEFTELIRGLQCQSMEDVSKILQRGVNVNEAMPNGWAAIHYASNYRHSCVALLLQYGANVNAKTNAGWTPLHGAVDSKSDSMVEYLLTHGANADVHMHDGTTPLHLAIGRDDASMVNILLNHSANWWTGTLTPFMRLMNMNDISQDMIRMIKKRNQQVKENVRFALANYPLADLESSIASFL